MTERFEFEVDTTAANENWHVEVEENLKQQAEAEKAEQPSQSMSPREEAPDVDRLARSMLLLHGAHDDDDHEPNDGRRRILVQGTGFRRSDRAAALREATQRDRERYLTVGPGFGRLPVLPRRGRRQEARARPHVGAVELRGVPALRVFRRDPGVRRRARPHPVLPEAGRQHQTRGGRRVFGGSVIRALPRRRLTPSSPKPTFGRQSSSKTRHFVDLDAVTAP